MISVGGTQLAEGKDFDSLGALVAKREVRQLNEEEAQLVASALTETSPTVTSVTEKPFTSKPQAPFMTSTLQQEAGRKLRLSAQMAMRTAQRLYESGWITYMRTDSTTLSEEAINQPALRPKNFMGTSTFPTHRVATTGKSRTPKKLTKLFDLLETHSEHLKKLLVRSKVTNCDSMSWSGCELLRLR